MPKKLLPVVALLLFGCQAPYAWATSPHLTKSDGNPRLYGAEYTHRNPLVKYHLLHIHGYNYDTIQAASNELYQYYKREYRAGLRGNFIGLTWPSGIDQNPKDVAKGEVVNNTSEEAIPNEFDGNIRNALAVGPVMMQFLSAKVHPWSGGADNVDVYGHSLGNLAMWEMLHAAVRPAVRNVYGSEAAVMSEPYREVPQRVRVPGHLSGVRDLLPWQFQSTTWIGRYADTMTVAIGNQYHHGFNRFDDPVFGKFRINDWINRQYGSTVPLVNLNNADGVLTLPGAAGNAVVAGNFLALVGGGDVTCKSDTERRRSERAAANLVEHDDLFGGSVLGDGPLGPRVHWNRMGPYLDPLKPLDSTRDRQSPPSWIQMANGQRLADMNGDGQRDAKVSNALAFEVPCLLDLGLIPNENGATQAFHVGNSGTGAYFELVFNQGMEMGPLNYAYTHLEVAHGARPSPLKERFPTTVFNKNMKEYNWREWEHTGHRDQSLPSAQSNYFEAMYGAKKQYLNVSRDAAEGARAFIPGEDRH